VKRPLVPLTLAYINGLVLGYVIELPGMLWLVAGMVALLVAVAGLRWSTSRVPALAALLAIVFLLGLLRWDMTITHQQQLQSEAYRFSRKGLGNIEATLLESSPSGEGETWRIESLVFTSERRSYPLKGQALVRLVRDSASPYQPGDRLRMQGRLFPIRAARLPGGPDWPGYYSARNIAVRVHLLDTSPEIMYRHGGVYFTTQRLLHRTRTRILGALERQLTPYRASLASAMLLGERGNFNSEQLARLRNSGLFHLTAVSGLHVMGLLLALFWTLRRLGLPRRAMALLALPIIVGFVMLSGARPPAVRAGLMVVFLIAGYLLDRETDTFNSLAVAALLNLLLFPHQLLEAGFQLSYLHHGGIAIALPAHHEEAGAAFSAYPQHVHWQSDGFGGGFANHRSFVAVSFWQGQHADGGQQFFRFSPGYDDYAAGIAVLRLLINTAASGISGCSRLCPESVVGGNGEYYHLVVRYELGHS
jgi:competence protein ComEC